MLDFVLTFGLSAVVFLVFFDWQRREYDQVLENNKAEGKTGRDIKTLWIIFSTVITFGLFIVSLLLMFAFAWTAYPDVSTDVTTYTYQNLTTFTNTTTCTGGEIVAGSCVGVGSSFSNEQSLTTSPFILSVSTSSSRSIPSGTDSVAFAAANAFFWMALLFGVLYLVYRVALWIENKGLQYGRRQAGDYDG